MRNQETAYEIISQFPAEKRYILSAMHEFQDRCGYVSSDHMKEMAKYFDVSIGNLFSDLTFYDRFTTEKEGSIVFSVCDGTVCSAKGSHEILKKIQETLGITPGHTTQDGRFSLRTVRCMGACEHAPVMVIGDDIYKGILPKDIENVVRSVDTGMIQEKRSGTMNIIPGKPPEILTKCYTNLSDYLRHGGGEALRKALDFDRRKQILEEVKKSGLRGRSGSGFPVGMKWEAGYNAKGRSSNFIDKYIVANGDEGDPGAFMDRWLLENNPYSVIEGMIVGGYCISANKGYIYIRDEYKDAINTVNRALQEMREHGMLGRRILDSDYTLDIEVVRAGRAYVCGEESALIESIEGNIGVPRIKPPFPTYRGILEQPTVINNIETFANIPFIIAKGGEEYSRIGKGSSTGTKIFSLSGDLNVKGNVEIPLGEITLKELIEEYGGGAAGGRKIKCVQVGGPLGSFITADELDVVLGFEEFANAGITFGSGGIIVLSEEVKAMDLLRNAVAFLSDESCGTCTPCREGLRILSEIVTKEYLAEQDIDLIEKIAQAAGLASRCAFGKAMCNPIRSIIMKFRQEITGRVGA
ncbi:MAG: NAD(P)H-dependent oxidoreductase subunit E [Firmicutes bacterium]|nr:NAD(P)H-dependent oxidoreductase subunit E [Bacillota bacterium]